MVDNGLKLSVLSAVLEHHRTEDMRGVVNDAMAIHGGKAISLAPKNYLAILKQADKSRDAITRVDDFSIDLSELSP